MCATRLAAKELGDWVESNGGSSANVLCGPTQYGLGLLATENMRAGDVAVSLPEECQLGAALPADGDALRSLHDSVPPEFWSARTGLLLLAERSKGDASHFESYVRTLPATYTIPLLWPPEAIKALKYPTTQQNLLKQAKYVQSFGSELASSADACFSGRRVDADALGWAVAASSSRALKIRDRRVLCPLIDLGNHAPEGIANCAVKGTLGGRVELVAQRDITAGEEVTFCRYGKLSNDDFLLDYGFLPESNPHDHVSLAWADGAILSTACTTAKVDVQLEEGWRRAALRTALPPGLAELKITRSGVDENALTACRIAIARDEAALRKADGGRKPLAAAGGEIRALRIAAAMVAIALTGLPEREEEAEGASETAGPGLAMAKQFLEEKRRLCSGALERLGERIKALQSGEAKAELRGVTKAKKVSGVRKTSARKGVKRPKATGGFGK